MARGAGGSSRRNVDTEDLVRAYARYNAGVLGMTGALASKSGLTLSEMAALEHLFGESPLSPTDLAYKLGLSASAVTDLTRRLVRRGLVHRERDPSDGRRVLLRYGHAPPELAAPLRSVQKRFLEEVEHMSRADKRAVHRFLLELSEAMEGLVERPGH